jgi:hypothetical protein
MMGAAIFGGTRALQRGGRERACRGDRRGDAPRV